MPHQKPRHNKKVKRGGWVLPAIAILIAADLAIIIIALALIGYYRGAMSGSGWLGGGEGGANGGGETGGLCQIVPEKYQNIFLGAARGEIPPALIAAIFAVEHGRVEAYKPGYAPTGSRNATWPEKDGDPQAITRWQTSSAGALGPMQFTPPTWQEYGVDGNGDGTKDVQNIVDASYGTGNMMKKNYGTQSGTHEERLKKVIARYNPGAGPWNNSWYVDKVWGYYQKFNCEGGGGTGGETLAGRLNVPYIPQADTGYCGRASQAMVIAFFDPANLNKYKNPSFQRNYPLSEGAMQKFTHRNYRYGNPSLDKVINSLSRGYPVLVYTDLYSQGQHIFVLTGFDGNKFWANDTFGSEARAKDIQTLGGIPLTKENLQKHLRPQNRHTFLYVP